MRQAGSWIKNNSGQTKSTKPFIPWELVYFEPIQSREQALAREKYFKNSSWMQIS